MLHRSEACFSIFLALLLSSVALAQEPDEEALARSMKLYENGTMLYEEGSYTQAALAFQEAYDLSKNYVFLYNISNAWERAGELDKALDYLNQYRVYADPEEAATLDRRLMALERRILEEERAAVARATAPQPLPEPPSTEAPSPSLPAAPSPPHANLTGPLLLASGAVIAAGFGAAAGITYSQSREYLDTGDRDAYEALRPLNQTSIVGAAVGGGLALTGLVVSLLHQGGASDLQQPSVHLRTALAPGGVQVGLTVHAW